MSSNTYTLKIDIDDSKIRELEKRLMAVMGGKTAGLSGLKDAATGNTDKGKLMSNISKLGAIAIGVGSLVALVSKISGMIVDSSPMLKGMLKLLNYSIMLILRPIGDFFGFLLRPIIIYFLRSIALPFYQTWQPIARKLGTFLGVGVADRQSEIDSIGGKPFWEEGFTMDDGMKNIEKGLLSYASFLDLFNEEDFQYQSTKEGIAALKGAFTALNGLTLPTIDLSYIKTGLEDLTLPTIDLSYIKTGLEDLTLPTIDLDGIQTKIDDAITAIGAFDFSEIFDTLETKFGKIFEDLWNTITSLFPWVDWGNNEQQTTPTTQQTVPPYAGSLEYVFGDNNKNQPEEDMWTSTINWIQGGINEHTKGWGLW